ncbi:MAG: RNA polymerase factor sigma-54 [Chitinophagaceae bacterium]
MITQQQIQGQRLKILPQQIQLLNLFFLNSLELEQHMKTQMEENPFLEMTSEESYDEAETMTDNRAEDDFQDWEEFSNTDKPDYKTEYQNYFDKDVAPLMAIAGKMHFKDDAKQQLRIRDLPALDIRIGEYIIDMLDNHGLMDRDMEEMADDLSFELSSIVEATEVERVLAIVQTLDPIGIGARSIQECLVMQLTRLEHTDAYAESALLLVRDHYEDLMHRQFDRIQHALGFVEDDLRNVLAFIGTLKFSPVTENTSSFQPKTTIIPDFIISRFGDSIKVNLQSTRSNCVYINQSLYDQLAAQSSTRDKGAAQYVKSKLQSAQWFVSAVKQREETMIKIMQTIVELQHRYFLEGDIRELKPMVLRIVAEKCGMDISTISRITSNKYADTHFGQIYLKDLFSEGIPDKNGAVISNKVIQSAIQEAIVDEDKKCPYTDLQLVEILAQQGYSIARRTVAKYRGQLQIPTAQIRAVWA